MAVNAKDLGAIEGEDSAPTPPDAPREDAEALKGLLARERAATLQVRSAKLGVQQKLADAEADFKKLAKKVQNSPPEQDPGYIKGQWDLAQKDLERAQAEHGRKTVETEAKLAQLHEALQVSEQARSLDSQSQKRQARIQIGAGVAATILLGGAILGVVHYLHAGKPVAVVREAVKSVPKQEKPEMPPTSKGGAVGQSGFSNGVGRLSSAFSRFGGVDPETIMRMVNKKAAASGSSVCAFAWNEGQPALQFGDGHGGNTSIEGTLTRCAEAVENFHE
jgi:hypothetical protein